MLTPYKMSKGRAISNCEIGSGGVSNAEMIKIMTSAYLNFAGDIAGTAASAYGAFQKSKPPTSPFADTGTPSGFSYGSESPIDYDIGLKTSDFKFFDY